MTRAAVCGSARHQCGTFSIVDDEGEAARDELVSALGKALEKTDLPSHVKENPASDEAAQKMRALIKARVHNFE
jgi:hypothetical protein